MKFRDGDRLVLHTGLQQSGNWLPEGCVFTVVGIEGSAYCCHFEKRYCHDFHDLDGRCSWGYGYYVKISQVDKCANLVIDNPDWEI